MSQEGCGGLNEPCLSRKWDWRVGRELVGKFGSLFTGSLRFNQPCLENTQKKCLESLKRQNLNLLSAGNYSHCIYNYLHCIGYYK